jgi:hypothetical protein
LLGVVLAHRGEALLGGFHGALVAAAAVAAAASVAALSLLGGVKMKKA